MQLTSILSIASDKVFGDSARRSAFTTSHALKTPPHFIELLLLVEDKRFFHHFGVDLIAIIRAIVFNLRGGVLQGASTIVQQLYRVKRGSGAGDDREARNLQFKLYQASWALLESLRNSKIVILREYLDGVYWGKSLKGLDQAAQAYFNVSRSELSPAQSFFLAERIATPNRFRPGRVSALLRRDAIQGVLRRYQVTTGEIADLYAMFGDSGGEICPYRVK